MFQYTRSMTVVKQKTEIFMQTIDCLFPQVVEGSVKSGELSCEVVQFLGNTSNYGFVT